MLPRSGSSPWPPKIEATLGKPATRCALDHESATARVAALPSSERDGKAALELNARPSVGGDLARRGLDRPAPEIE
jgi:hypothetical protein